MALFKKAQEGSTILTVGNYLILLIAIAPLLYYIHAWSANPTFEKNWAAKDVALFIDTVYAAPSTVFAEYQVEKDNYDLQVELAEKATTSEGDKKIPRVVISQINDQDIKWYPFAHNGVLPSSDSGLKLMTGITISKLDDKVTLTKGFNGNMLVLGCEDIPTQQESWESGKIVLDKNGDESSWESISELLRYLIDPSAGEYLKNGVVIPDRTDDKLVFIQSQDPAMVVSVRSSMQGNNIKAFYPIQTTGDIEKKDRKLACLILNEISKQRAQLKITGTAIVAVYPEDYDELALPTDRISIAIDIGNRKDVLDRWTMLKPAIYQGIKEYYTK